ncbi:uncharacterized protein F4822DRAFT_208217 [Hypoxylon trugodes]|uniref:uncharacterized protein n=1 Tax=Hypoxylon trugodes TaxID=326681 RepID=UPI002193BC6C|nr:uncharacterized protein F4822DRAFT_208217 [Hypoxylon trugodes]KAI1389669.1 hypothetical protein F4822DRAFT_208217 [Hypoxylon trugodes]
MDPSSESYIDPEQLIQPSENTTTYSSSIQHCAPELAFQPPLIPPPMEFIDGPLEYQRTPNGANICIGQEGLAELGYGTPSDMPMDLHNQRTDPRNNSMPRPRTANKHAKDIYVKQENERSFYTHSRRSSRSSNKFTSDESGLDKRERNRMAASKCRKKQKQANSELQERARIMDEQHSYLIAHKASLESEMIGLKNELLLHGGCGCEPISEYLMQAAKRFVKNREGDAHGLEKTGNLRERPPSISHEPCVL